MAANYVHVHVYIYMPLVGYMYINKYLNFIAFCLSCSHKGAYAYLDLRDPTLSSGNNAMLNSALRSPPDSGADCLGLWYHIDAVDVGTMNVYTLTNGTLSDVIWSIGGNRDDYWWFAGINMVSDAPFQVRWIVN